MIFILLYYNYTGSNRLKENVGTSEKDQRPLHFRFASGFQLVTINSKKLKFPTNIFTISPLKSHSFPIITAPLKLP